MVGLHYKISVPATFFVRYKKTIFKHIFILFSTDQFYKTLWKEYLRPLLPVSPRAVIVYLLVIKNTVVDVHEYTHKIFSWI